MFGLGKKKEDTAEHDHGIGRIRERTIVIGAQVIAIQNIGSIRILKVGRSWLLTQIGILVALLGIAGPMVPGLNRILYQLGGGGASFSQLFLAAGVVLFVINLLMPRRKALSIGTGDGRVSLVISENHAFLERLLNLLIDKINTKNETLVASFDISNTVINSGGGAVVVGDNAMASGMGGAVARSESGGLAIGDHAMVTGAGGAIARTDTGGIAIGEKSIATGAAGSVATSNIFGSPAAAAPPRLPEPEPEPEPTPPPPQPGPTPGENADDALFADLDAFNDKPPPATPPTPPPEKSATIVAMPPPRPPPQAERRRPYDALLDGGAPPPANDDDWLSRPRAADHAPASSEGGGAGRVLLAMLIIALLGSGVFATWYFTGQTGPASSLSLIAENDDSTPDMRGATTPEAVTPTTVEAAVPEDLLAEGEAIPAEELTPAARVEIEDFLPPEPLVARASGLRYRASPSQQDNVPILSETRSGGEALRVDGRVVQADGEWYRVSLVDGRTAWFKASLAVPRSRFADALRPTSDASLPFAASAPRILEPAEGVQLSGGPQPVLLAWQHRDETTTYIVEVERYDPVEQRWIETPLHRRITVDGETQVAETIPSAGFWRWRVRGVSPAGEQSDFSRWAAFGIRN